MTRATWVAILSAMGTCFLGNGCGPSQTTQRVPATQKAEETAAERLARVRRLAIAGPDTAGAAEALAEFLDTDEDLSVRKVAAVGLLSFGDKAIEPLRKKHPAIPVPDVEPQAPNPEPAPDSFLGLTDWIVYHDPYFAGGLFPACVELTQDADPAIRIVSVRAITNLMDRYSPQLDMIRAAAKGPKHDLHKGAKEFLQQRAELLEAIRKLTKDDDDKVREAAKEALKRLGE